MVSEVPSTLYYQIRADFNWSICLERSVWYIFFLHVLFTLINLPNSCSYANLIGCWKDLGSTPLSPLVMEDIKVKLMQMRKCLGVE